MVDTIYFTNPIVYQYRSNYAERCNRMLGLEIFFFCRFDNISLCPHKTTLLCQIQDLFHWRGSAQGFSLRRSCRRRKAVTDEVYLIYLVMTPHPTSLPLGHLPLKGKALVWCVTVRQIQVCLTGAGAPKAPLCKGGFDIFYNPILPHSPAIYKNRHSPLAVPAFFILPLPFFPGSAFLSCRNGRRPRT